MTVPIVFLSHSSRDADVVRALKEVLARHTLGAIEWWLSSDGQSIRGGKNWRSEVEQALRDCRLLFILFTPTARQSAWVQFEAGFADALGKDIVPIALPGFDIDLIPGPLQHKQGFNLRGSSGLNNIISVSNRVLGRHDLLSFEESDYREAFAGLPQANELSQLLDIYVREIKLRIGTSKSAIDVIDAKARKRLGEDLVGSKVGDEQVLAGPGFVVRQARQTKKTDASPTAAAPDETTYWLNGEIIASALFELLPVFSDSEIAPLFLNGGSMEFELRAGSAALTHQAPILGNMKGTAMRWGGDRVCSFGDISFSSRVRDINQPSVWSSISHGIHGRAAPEPYRPRELRYSFTLSWLSGFPGSAIASLLGLLMEREVIATAETLSGRR